jgi:hypothetical protein
MDALHIKRLEARYHLTPSTLSAKDRLDQLLREMLDGAVELALEHNGISPHAELCIRRLTVPVRLRLGASDQALVAQWGYSFAEHIREALEQNDGVSVVHYRSRLHGLIDFASGVALRHYRRAWAWAQLGFVRLSDGESDAQYANQLMQAFLNEPETIVPVLKGLARSRRLTKLIGCLHGDWWDELAEAALQAAGADPASHLKASAQKDPDSVRALRLVKTSSLAGAVMDQPSGVATGHVSLSAFSVLVALESEPGLFLGDSDEVASIVKGIESLLRARIVGVATDIESTFENIPEQHRGLSPDSALGPGPDDTEPGRADHKPQRDSNLGMRSADPNAGKTKGRSSASQEPGSITAPEGRISPIVDASPATNDKVSNNAFVPETRSAETPPVDDDYALPEIRASGSTAFGGLLFLLKIVELLGLPNEIVRHPALSQRPMRWVLYQLALVLIDADVSDPALLAFCGLEPGTTLPWDDETPVTDLEHALLLRWRAAMVELLRSRLERNGVSDARLLDEVCRRRARIVADPGWIEVIYSLNDVSTEYRRAALDLDPGYLPWLGIVVTFTYPLCQRSITRRERLGISRSCLSFRQCGSFTARVVRQCLGPTGRWPMASYRTVGLWFRALAFRGRSTPPRGACGGA